MQLIRAKANKSGTNGVRRLAWFWVKLLRSKCSSDIVMGERKKWPDNGKSPAKKASQVGVTRKCMVKTGPVEKEIKAKRPHVANPTSNQSAYNASNKTSPFQLPFTDHKPDEKARQKSGSNEKTNAIEDMDSLDAETNGSSVSTDGLSIFNIDDVERNQMAAQREMSYSIKLDSIRTDPASSTGLVQGGAPSAKSTDAFRSAISTEPQPTYQVTTPKAFNTGTQTANLAPVLLSNEERHALLDVLISWTITVLIVAIAILLFTGVIDHLFMPSSNDNSN